jgi:asparaginyl-tRNA synthetase
MVHRYPAEVKAFYMKRDPQDRDEGVVRRRDRAGGVGRSSRQPTRDDLTALESRIDEHKLPKEAFQWYLDLRRYGSVPHAGFGLGLERTVAWIAAWSTCVRRARSQRMLYRIYPNPNDHCCVAADRLQIIHRRPNH